MRYKKIRRLAERPRLRLLVRQAAWNTSFLHSIVPDMNPAIQYNQLKRDMVD